ncbi:MAG: alpha-ketoacid dehydrogenase subunit beta [Candidatus Geothermarchaeales archaeon]
MPVLNLVQAINAALEEEMMRDGRVLIMGEDVGVAGGVFRVTDGLLQKFGPERVIDTPLAESGIVGTAIGMALYGLKPIVEIQFMDFIYPAFDQIVSELVKMRYRSGGEFLAPVVIRTPYGGGIKGAHYHSQSSEAFFVHMGGLKVVVPSNPYDAKGLLKSAVRDEDPVIFMEPKRIYRTVKMEVPEDDYTIPIGEAQVVREGTDVTLFTYGAMVHEALRAADLAEKEGVETKVMDLRTLVPLDIEAVLKAVRETGRVVVHHEAPRTCGFGAELVAQIAEKALEYLEAPVRRVTGFDTPFPYKHEKTYLPNATRLSAAIRDVGLFE